MANEAHPLIGISLTVSDMTKSLAFYRRLGVAIPDEAIFAVDGVGHHVAVEMPGGFTFELDSAAMTRSYFPSWSPGTESSNTLIFSVPNAGRSRQAIRRHDLCRLHRTARTLRCVLGRAHAVLDDPDGNHVGIMSPMDEKHASAPPQL